MTTAQQFILFGVGVYFLVGAMVAHAITALSVGFTGKFSPMAIAAFFGWPIFFLFKFLGPLVFALPWVAAAGAMVALAYFVLRVWVDSL